MNDHAGPSPEPTPGARRGFDDRHLLIWGAVAAISVLLLFHVLHATMDNHALAIIASGLGGMAIGGAGYRWRSAERSLGGPALAGLAGGALGLFVLHLLPLLH